MRCDKLPPANKLISLWCRCCRDGFSDLVFYGRFLLGIGVGILLELNLLDSMLTAHLVDLVI